jgi:hypothetical protein
LTLPEHIVATLVDLAVRDHVAIDASADADWRVTVLHNRSDRLARYEKQLLRALFPFRRAHTVRLSTIPKSRHRALGKVHALLIRDVLRGGVVDLSASGEGEGPDLRGLRDFRAQLRTMPAVWIDQPRYLPYVITFGLGPQWAQHVLGTASGWLRTSNLTGAVGAFTDNSWVSMSAGSWTAAHHHSGGGGHHGYGGHGGHGGGHGGGGHH